MCHCGIEALRWERGGGERGSLAHDTQLQYFLPACMCMYVGMYVYSCEKAPEMLH